MDKVWIIWALRRERCDLVAITDDEHKAHYIEQGRIIYPDAKIHPEQSKINHLFGENDLVASRLQRFR